MVAASRRATAQPLFMSQVPRPCIRLSSRRAGRLSLSGTVSRWPAITTRSPCPCPVRATTLVARRVTSRWLRLRRAASTASAISCSLPLTDSMFTSCSVSVTASSVRSSGGVMTPSNQASPTEHAELVALGIGHHVPADLVVPVAQNSGAGSREVGGVAEDVPVDPVLDGLGLRDGDEVHRGDREAGNVLQPPPAVLRVARRFDAEDLRPPGGDLPRFRRVDDEPVDPVVRQVTGPPEERAELAALRIDHHRPLEARLLGRQHDLGAERHEVVEVGGVDVEVHPVLDGPRLGHSADRDAVALGRPEEIAVLLIRPVRQATHLRPEPPKRLSAAGVHAELLEPGSRGHRHSFLTGWSPDSRWLASIAWHM